MGGFLIDSREHLLIDLFSELLEGDGLLYGELRKYLSVEFDALCLGGGDKATIGESEFAKRVSEADNPKSAEGTLFVATVTAGILPGFDERFFCGDEIRLTAPAETNGLRQYIFPSLVCGDAAFYSSHNVSVKSNAGLEGVGESMEDILRIFLRGEGVETLGSVFASGSS